MTDALTLDMGELDVDEFAEFWAAYPRHKDRARAELAYRRARRVETRETILARAREYATSVGRQPVEKRQIATSWLSRNALAPVTVTAPPKPKAIAGLKAHARRGYRLRQANRWEPSE